jgi:hypothetical protein
MTAAMWRNFVFGDVTGRKTMILNDICNGSTVPGDGFVYLRKRLVNGSIKQLRIPYNNLSCLGLFIVTGDVGIFDIDEEVEIVLGSSISLLTTVCGHVVGSKRSFQDSQSETTSGYSILFDRPTKG